MEKDEKRYVWVLLLEKSLQSEQELMDGINTVWIYDCFSKAKATMEQMLWQFASEKNGIFDGRGGILGLQSWLKEVGDVSEARILPLLVQNYIYQKEMNDEERREIDWSSPLSVGSVQWEGAGSIYFSGQFGKWGAIYLHIHNLAGLEETAVFNVICKQPEKKKEWLCIEISKMEVNEPWTTLSSQIK